MRVLHFLILVACSLLYRPVLADALVQLNGDRIELKSHFYAQVDPTNTLTIKDIADPANASRFHAGDSLQRTDYLDGAVWLKFTLARSAYTSQEWWLEVQPALYDLVTLYREKEDGTYVASQAGSSLRFSERELQYRNPVFKLQVAEGNGQTYYLKINSEKAALARITLWQPAAFVEAVAKEQLAFGLYLGAYALLVLAGLWFEFAVRDRIYLYFSLYVMSCIFTTLTDNGLWQQYIMPDQPQWFNLIAGSSMILLTGSCMQFMFRFIEMHKHRPRLNRIFLSALWLFCGAVFAGILSGHYQTATRISHLALPFAIGPLAVICLFRPALRSAKEIRFALIVSGMLLFVSITVYTLVQLGKIERNMLTGNVMYISSMLFFLVIYYSISRRYNSMRIAKEAAQQKAYKVLQQSEQELEQQVMLRTRELLDAMNTVEQALTHEKSMRREQRHYIEMVSHELKTPLAVIDATTQNLTRETHTPGSKTQVRLEKIRQATERLSLLFNDYMSDDRFDDLAGTFQPAELAVLPLLQDAKDSAQVISEQHLISVNSACDVLWADRELLRLVLRTLVENAAKYTPSGTHISLHAAESGKGWHLDVADDGPGIPPEERLMIFKRRYRGSSSAQHSGSGLGLPLARRLIEMHGGTLTLLASSTPGCTFRIFLPRPLN